MSESDHPETIDEAIEWMDEQQSDARSTYKDGARSENPRQTDIALGRLRAYRDCKRVLKQMRAQNHR